MKTRINKTYLPAVRLALCAGVLLLSACTKDDTSGLSVSGDALITLQAQLPKLGIEQEPGFESRAVADPTKALTLYFSRADETGEDTGIFGAYSSTALPATRTAGVGSAALTFDTPQYYFNNNVFSRFTGWHPAATSITGGVVSWTLDGSQDILTAVAQQGNFETPVPTFSFKHKLSKLQFEVVADASDAVASWGTISGINVLAQSSTCTYTLSTGSVTGAVALSGSTTYGVKNFPAGALTTTAVAKGDPIFISPSTTNVALSLQVVSSRYGTIVVPVPARTYETGKAYKLTILFGFTSSEIAVTVVPWNDVTSDDEMGKLQIGDAINDGVVYWIDPADALQYKVVSVTASPSDLYWAAADNYGIGTSAQSDTDGKANYAAIRAYYEANKGGTGTQSTFEETFPAPAYCYNYRGKSGTDAPGTWYLPAQTDLQYLWCAYNGVAPISWASGTDASAPVDATAQAVFNKYLIDAGGANMAKSLLWSSTAYSPSTDYAWFVNFSSGYTSTSGTSSSSLNFYVRCVKSLPLPAIGDVKDGGIIYWIDPADATHYKVVALTEAPTTLRWAVKNTYVIGSGAQSDTDAKGNAAAIKAYYETNKGGTVTESTFDAAFPAAAYCYNYQGKSGSDAKGTWYLPAKTDLQYLWCAFNDKTPISWETDTNASVPSDATAQTKFNKYLTDAGGANMAKSFFWSGTENSNNSNLAWYVYFSTGNTDTYSKSTSCYVRCVRDL